MSDTNKPVAPEAAAMALPEFCPRDGDVLYAGTKFGYPAWLCPTCTYWKLRTVTAALSNDDPA